MGIATGTSMTCRIWPLGGLVLGGATSPVRGHCTRAIALPSKCDMLLKLLKHGDRNDDCAGCRVTLYS